MLIILATLKVNRCYYFTDSFLYYMDSVMRMNVSYISQYKDDRV